MCVVLIFESLESLDAIHEVGPFGIEEIAEFEEFLGFVAVFVIRAWLGFLKVLFFWDLLCIEFVGFGFEGFFEEWIVTGAFDDDFAQTFWEGRKQGVWFDFDDVG